MLNTQKHTTLFSLGLQPGIKPVFFIFLIFFQVFCVKSQENLVPNGSFEEYLSCPDIDAPYNYVDRAKYWFNPTTGSSDYFNACSDYFDVTTNSLLFSVPQNYIGYQEARSGNGYAGYYAVLTPFNDGYHEYISVKLNKKLEKGKLYTLTYYISLADSMSTGGKPQQYINHSGAYISSTLINEDNYDRILENPQVFSDPSVFLNDSLDWQKIEGVFNSEGGEEFLTIGSFCKFEDVLYNFSLGSNNYVQPYYYIDDVVMEEVDFEFPNVFTPNNDDVNDVVFKHENLFGLEIDILNRWGNIVKVTNFSEGWNGTDNNGTHCTAGVYFYVIKKNEDKIKTGYIHLIR